jgi:3-isopropylmalate/(R)-2-methylmalate dehydratase small subunit
MEPFVRLTGATAPLDRANVDTDQIIPKQFLKRIERTGFGEFLFFDWRNNDPDFVLARPEFRDAPILVAGANFGSGSSREHAPWALQDWGYRAVIAPSYADIFRSNCSKVGLLCVVLPEADVAELLAAAPAEVTIDLELRTVTLPSGRDVSFDIDPTTRQNLLNGWDDIALTFNREDEIAAYEGTRERTGPDILALGT